MDSPVVGIDLGTSKSVAFICGANGLMRKLTTSGDKDLKELSKSHEIFVNFSDSSCPIYYEEREMHAIKRLIGKSFTEASTENFGNFAFQVNNFSNEIYVQLVEEDQRVDRRPQELSYFILRKIKNDIEDNLKTKVERAVLTIPSCFNSSQRKATVEAATLAGFIDVTLINDPVATALSYSFKHFEFETKYYFVFDLGGGSFDVAIIYRDQDLNHHVIAVDGDSDLGGRDFDDIIMNYVCDTFYQLQRYNLVSNKKQARWLLGKCEEAKIILSSVKATSINIETLMDFSGIMLTRKQLEEMCNCLIEKTIKITKRCLKTAMVPPTLIDAVILVGGSSRIPKIHELLVNFFKGKTLINNSYNQFYGNAEGAALQGYNLFHKQYQNDPKPDIYDVLPLSIGIADASEKIDFVFRKNTPIPNSATRELVRVRDEQNFITLHVFQGENPSKNSNHYIGQWKITDLTPFYLGRFKIIVKINVNSNGFVVLSASENGGNYSRSLTCLYEKKNLELYDIDFICINPEKFLEKQKSPYQFNKLKFFLWEYCRRIVSENDTNQPRKQYSSTVINRCKEIMKIVKEQQENDEKKLGKMIEEIKAMR